MHVQYNCKNAKEIYLFSLGIQNFFLFKINRKSNKNQLMHQILFYLKYLRDRFK